MVRLARLAAHWGIAMSSVDAFCIGVWVGVAVSAVLTYAAFVARRVL